MEKKQSELCHEVLRRLNRARVLKDFILIGSWCLYFYKDYFQDTPYIDQATIKTRDIDLLISDPEKITNEIDIPDMLKDLGFVITFKGKQGYIKLDHPDLIFEFLVPEKGRGIDKPVPLPKLGMNATPLRFLSFLYMNTIKVKVEDFYITLPHPINFALHKLIISQRRQLKEKSIKDRDTDIKVLKALVNKGESDVIKKIFDSTPLKWQKKIITGIEKADAKEFLHILK